MTFIWRTTAGAKKYITIRQNQFLASNGKRAWLSLNVTLCVFFKSILIFLSNNVTWKAVAAIADRIIIFFKSVSAKCFTISSPPGNSYVAVRRDGGPPDSDCLADY